MGDFESFVALQATNKLKREDGNGALRTPPVLRGRERGLGIRGITDVCCEVGVREVEGHSLERGRKREGRKRIGEA